MEKSTSGAEKPESCVAVNRCAEALRHPKSLLNPYSLKIRLLNSLLRERFDYSVVKFGADLFDGLIGAVGPGAVG